MAVGDPLQRQAEGSWAGGPSATHSAIPHQPCWARPPSATVLHGLWPGSCSQSFPALLASPGCPAGMVPAAETHKGWCLRLCLVLWPVEGCSVLVMPWLALLRQPHQGSLPSTCMSAGPRRGVWQRSCRGAGLVPHLRCSASVVSSPHVPWCAPPPCHVWCVSNLHVSNEARRASLPTSWDWCPLIWFVFPCSCYTTSGFCLVLFGFLNKHDKCIPQCIMKQCLMRGPACCFTARIHEPRCPAVHPIAWFCHGCG